MCLVKFIVFLLVNYGSTGLIQKRWFSKLMIRASLAERGLRIKLYASTRECFEVVLHDIEL